jgi:hypothetical protein
MIVLLLICLVGTIISLGISILTIAGHWIVYQKANQPGWYSLIPIFNIYTKSKFTNTTKDFWLYIIFSCLGTALAQFSNMMAFCNLPISITESVGPILQWLPLLSLLLALAALVFMIKIECGVARVFGKSASFGIGLAFLPFVFYPILAISKSEYIPIVNDDFAKAS